MTASLTFADSILINADPNTVYATVSDVTRTGEWSPICRECWWDDGDGPQVGAWFTGRNVTADREWETRSQVIVADDGRAFGWSVGPGRVHWTYRVEAVDGGTRLTESWEFLPEGQEFFVEKYGDRADEQVAERTAAARKGIPETLRAIKRVIEQQDEISRRRA
ncbi:SRPBCC family protein [Brevibacterium atlanticum]|uniref:SRPBCC family protein n=1 Tax=Brevibacterium atlanticum TaxID=2697563 RepID=UPI0014201860|nr:SRPBCC family protein [Brevibacterium atlanticum]